LHPFSGVFAVAYTTTVNFTALCPGPERALFCVTKSVNSEGFLRIAVAY